MLGSACVAGFESVAFLLYRPVGDAFFLQYNASVFSDLKDEFLIFDPCFDSVFDTDPAMVDSVPPVVQEIERNSKFNVRPKLCLI